MAAEGDHVEDVFSEYEVSAELIVSSKGYAQPHIKLRYWSKDEAKKNLEEDGEKLLTSLEKIAKKKGYPLAKGLDT